VRLVALDDSRPSSMIERELRDLENEGLLCSHNSLLRPE